MNKPRIKKPTRRKYQYLFGTTVKTFQQLKDLYPQEMFQPQADSKKRVA